MNRLSRLAGVALQVLVVLAGVVFVAAVVAALLGTAVWAALTVWSWVVHP